MTRKDIKRRFESALGTDIMMRFCVAAGGRQRTVSILIRAHNIGKYECNAIIIIIIITTETALGSCTAWRIRSAFDCRATKIVYLRLAIIRPQNTTVSLGNDRVIVNEFN